MGRSVRPWWLALAGSLLLHVGLLGGLEWRLPQWASPPEPSTIDVQLVTPPKPVSRATAAATPAPPAPRRLSSPRQAASRPPLPSPVAPLPELEPVAEAAAPEAPAGPDLADVVAAPPSPVGPASPVVAPAPLNDLPPRIDMRFQLRYGLASGEQTLVWVNAGERYTLTSVAAATGLTGIFYRGRFVQTSRGRITPRGLQPEEFWDQRGNARSSARFDAANGDLLLDPAKGPPRHFAYSGDVQDALSLFFQLALTAPPPSGQLTYRVFNGKKLRDYTYEVRGEETLATALGPLRTLHLARVADDDDGRFEAWLAIDRHYLPVRVLRSDDKGNEMELRVESIAP